MAYNQTLQLEWDEAKSDACFRLRGFDFAYAASVFADPLRVVRRDTRHSYGEDRYEVTGSIEERLFVVVFTTRQDAIRIISARKANQREARRHENRSNDT
jgi:uncharacterized DUF497 family protein